MKMQDYIHAADRIEIADHCREEILNMTADTAMKTKKPAIRMITGIAVAAAVIALNGALIFTLYSAKNNNDFPLHNADSGSIPEPMTDAEYEVYETDLDTINLHPIKGTGSELPDLAACGLNRDNFCRMKEPYEYSLNEEWEWNYQEKPPAETYLQYRDQTGTLILTDENHIIQAIVPNTGYEEIRIDKPDMSLAPAEKVLSIKKLHQKAEQILTVLVPDYERYSFSGESKEVHAEDFDPEETLYVPYVYHREHAVNEHFSEQLYLLLHADGSVHQLIAFRNGQAAPETFDIAAYDAEADAVAQWRTQDAGKQKHSKLTELCCINGHYIARYQFPGEDGMAVNVCIAPEYTLRPRMNSMNLLAEPAVQEYSFGKVTVNSITINGSKIKVLYSFAPADWLKEKETAQYQLYCNLGARIYDQDGVRNGYTAPREGESSPGEDGSFDYSAILDTYAYYNQTKGMDVPAGSTLKFYVSDVTLFCYDPSLEEYESSQHGFQFYENIGNNDKTEYDPIFEIQI